ncbi:hypothetical protein NSA23_04920 [Anaerosalibacter massiliensis]|uniref:Uncharacterized protein n=1 Tax=Anaerosalibacter massiliensis TaxID=1347392 RepID=A0A9X2S6C2_9FIRM|nr:hypothetical protein [Anaerosalibacter massiliensis]
MWVIIGILIIYFLIPLIIVMNIDLIMRINARKDIKSYPSDFGLSYDENFIEVEEGIKEFIGKSKCSVSLV